MSDMPDPTQKSEEEEGETPPASVAGKGWDILVGGKQNPYVAGGADPFDQGSGPAASTAPPPFAKDAETDAILKAASAQGQAASGPLPPEALYDKGRGAESPRDLSPDELAKPGVSAGVTVTPLPPVSPAAPAPATPVLPGISEVGKPTGVPGITEVSKPALPAVPVSPVKPQPATGPASGAIVEVSPPTARPLPVAGGVTTPAPRAIPTAGPVAPIPVVPGLAIPPGRGAGATSAFTDPFTTQSDMVVPRDQADLPANPALEQMLITPQRINALWNEINETYDLVVSDVRGHFNTTESALDDLRQARELMLSDEANFDNAEELVKEVKARLRLEEKVRQWSRGRGAWLATYLVLWLFLVIVLIYTTNRLPDALVNYVTEPIGSAWLPLLFGALGGVIGALWILVKHITRKRDFDPIHTMWYVTNPFMGAALGLVTYFIVRGSGWLLTQVGGGNDFKLTMPVALTLDVLALVAGFNQNVFSSLVDRFVKAVVPEVEGDNTAATDTAQSQGGSGASASPNANSSASSGPNAGG